MRQLLAMSALMRRASDRHRRVPSHRRPGRRVGARAFSAKDFGEILAEVRRKLIDGRGIVMLQGFPVEGLTREDQAISYLGLGSYLGRMPQNKQGHVLGHVDLGGDYNDPNTRGYHDAR
jgi:hypothetical protein